MSETQGKRPRLLTVVTPAFNEAANLPLLFNRLRSTLDGTGCSWEWVVVDDHSSDGTFEVLKSLSSADPRVRALRFSKNFGSHTALRCGLENAAGDCAVVLAADLQDPPETIPALLDRWSSGSQLVWAVRRRREGEKAATLGFAKLYYWIMRRFVGLKDIPETGADFFLADACILEALRSFKEENVSVFALLTWMGFKQSFVEYDKQARVHGRSGWSVEKKLKLVIDSVTSFTYMPVRLMSYVGFMVAVLGFSYAAFIVAHALLGSPIQGWSSLMVVILVIGGIQMLMMGILGEYLWRSLDESRRRPRYLVEDRCGGVATGDGEGGGTVR